MDADVVIAWAHSGFPEAAKSAFQRPTKFIVMPSPNWNNPLENVSSPSPVRAIVAQYAPGVTPTRVATLGFSASCQGVHALLASSDGGNLDAAIAIDGIHTGRPVTQAAMTNWLNFAKLAFLNDRLFVVTHSAVKPPTYASTTETAEWLWTTLNGNSQSFTDPPVPDLAIPPKDIHVLPGPATGAARTVSYPTPAAKPQRRRGGLIILGFENRDIPMGTADHIYQAQAVMPAVLAKLLAARWNAIDPKSPDSACYVG